jgi:hypothetical protein
MATLTISSVGGDLRTIIRDWIFADGLASQEDRGWFRSNFRVRGDATLIDRLSSRIERARAILIRKAAELQREEDWADLARLARRSYRRDLLLLWERSLLGIGATRDDFTRDECETIHGMLVMLEDAVGDEDALRRLDLATGEIGGMLYGRDTADGVVSTMLKMRLAAIREDFRKRRLRIAGGMDEIEKLVGRRRLPSLA